MPQHPVPVGPPPFGAQRTLQRGNLDLVNQVAAECCLGQDLDIQERRRRLQRQFAQLLEAMEPARRIDVAGRHGEN
jgi:hypothetical protein